jgi:Tfp pilus assembly protein PilE
MNIRVSQRSGRGLTIIELVVIVAIAIVLAAFATAVYMSAQAKSRDTHRIEDMREVQNALGIYYASYNQFPVATNPTALDGTDHVSNALVSANIIPAVSGDPWHPDMSYTYKTDALGALYTITFCLETDSVLKYSKGCGNTITP